MPVPRQPVPAMTVPTVAHGEFDVRSDGAERFTLIVVYRGLHCPICLRYLREFGRLLPEFERRGVKLIAISTDEEARARTLAGQLEQPALRIGYGLPVDVARSWGLFISSSRGKTSTGVEEPDRFVEPGLFLVRSDGTLYFASVQTMPFARPHPDELLSALDFAIEKNYPARGEVVAGA